MASSSTSGVARSPQDNNRCRIPPPPIAISQCTAAFFRPAPNSQSKRASAENSDTGQRDSCDSAMTGLLLERGANAGEVLWMVARQGVKLATIGLGVGLLAAFLVTYTTRLPDWEQLLEQPDRLEIDLPDEISGQAWDVILVDAPAE